MILLARKASRRTRRCTLVAKRVRKSASSSAVSPPPTTATSSPLKKKPSQVAHELTPRPRRRVSDSSPSQIADAPVATITASAVNSRPALHTRNGCLERSTRSTSWSTTTVPNRSACARIFTISSGPSIPSGKPGKFSTSLVSISWPPGAYPASRVGSNCARAA